MYKRQRELYDRGVQVGARQARRRHLCPDADSGSRRRRLQGPLIGIRSEGDPYIDKAAISGSLIFVAVRCGALAPGMPVRSHLHRRFFFLRFGRRKSNFATKFAGKFCRINFSVYICSPETQVSKPGAEVRMQLSRPSENDNCGNSSVGRAQPCQG